MKIFVGTLILLVFSNMFYVQCSKESPLSTIESPNILASYGNNDYAVHIKYVTEVTTHFIIDEEVTEILDMAAQTPIITKQNVVLEISSKGDVFMQLTDLIPSQSLNIQHETPEGNILKPQKTIIENGKLKMFNATNVQVYEEPIDFDNAIDIINALEQINEPNAVINQLIMEGQYDLYLDDLNEVLNNPSAFGVTVTQFQNDLVAIQKTIDATNTTSDFAISLFNKTNNRLISSDLYNSNNEWLSSILFEYNTGNNPTLKGTLERAKHILPSGLNAYVETHSTYENFEIDVNL